MVHRSKSSTLAPMSQTPQRMPLIDALKAVAALLGLDDDAALLLQTIQTKLQLTLQLLSGENQ